MLIACREDGPLGRWRDGQCRGRASWTVTEAGSRARGEGCEVVPGDLVVVSDGSGGWSRMGCERGGRRQVRHAAGTHRLGGIVRSLPGIRQMKDLES